MKADLTRLTFDPLKHYSRVVAQQGRVQIDADANEQASIMTYYLRRMMGDLIGPCGGPVTQPGFMIAKLDPAIGSPMDFLIGNGRYYVDGILCELEATQVAITSMVAGKDAGTFLVTVTAWTVDEMTFQKGQYVWLHDQAVDLTLPPPPGSPPPTWACIKDLDGPSQTLTLTDIGGFVKASPKQPVLQRFPTFQTQPDFAPPALTTGQLYLDVWERVITWVEDDSIREVALNGPDTSARTKVVWQIKLYHMNEVVGGRGNEGAGPQCMTPLALAAQFQPASRGLLRARAKPGQAPPDPCTIAPEASYRGPENQLYRVEIHTGTSDPQIVAPTFKWSRENGSVVLPIASGGGTNLLVLETLGRDERFGLREGDWVEIQDDTSVLQNRADPLVQVLSIDRGSRTVTLSAKPLADPDDKILKHPLLRRWDHKFGPAAADSSVDNAVPIRDLKAPPAQDVWIDLEDGVQVQFVAPAKATYRTGDYWLIPARVATGDVEWPTEAITAQGTTTTTEGPVALPPHGVTHHYAPLAIIQVDATAKTVTGIKDCRTLFGVPEAAAPPLVWK